jgi:DNA-binding NtrC family response regulator
MDCGPGPCDDQRARKAGWDRPYRIERVRADLIRLVPKDGSAPIWLSASLEPKRILIVIDDHLVRFVLADCLDDQGFEVATARTADDALTMLEDGHGFDAVVSGIDMQGSIDGIGLARWLLDQRPGVPVFLMCESGRAGRDLPSGVGCAPKPICPSRLADLIWSAIIRQAGFEAEGSEDRSSPSRP